MDVTRWRRDPIAFIRDVLRDPETGAPFVLYPAQEEFLRLGLTLTADGRLPFAELVFAAPKKSGKTAIAAMSMLYAVIVLGGRYAEGYCVANDLEQAQGRVFEACRRLVETSPVLRSIAQLTQVKITFTGTAGTISALASDYASAAGSNPTFVSFDELWAYTSERSRRLWDELVPGVPTRRVSGRLTTTYAGFDGESELLWQLYQRGLQGEVVGPSLYRQPGLLMAWHVEPIAPWQTPGWIETMRLTLRPSAFLRMIRNTFASAESTFVDPAWWAACEDAALHPVVADPRLPVRRELVRPGTTRVLPAVLQPLPHEHALGILDDVPLHAIDDVVHVREAGLGEQVDGNGPPAAGSTHGHDRVFGFCDFLHAGDEIGKERHGELLLGGVPLVRQSGDGDLPGHRRMADEEELLGRANVENQHLLGFGLPFLVGLLARHVEAQDRLFRLRNPCV
jgi:hypothetical protein